MSSPTLDSLRRWRRAREPSSSELVSLGFRLGNPSAIGWHQPGIFQHPVTRGRPRTTSRRIATRSLRPEAQAEQVASVHVFSSQEGRNHPPRRDSFSLEEIRPRCKASTTVLTSPRRRLLTPEARIRTSSHDPGSICAAQWCFYPQRSGPLFRAIAVSSPRQEGNGAPVLEINREDLARELEARGLPPMVFGVDVPVLEPEEVAKDDECANGSSNIGDR
jgi:hypothetical protein